MFEKKPKDGIEYTKSALASLDVAAVVKIFHIGWSDVVSVIPSRYGSRVCGQLQSGSASAGV